MALGKFGVDFKNCGVCKGQVGPHHVGPHLFTHHVQMFSYICDLRGHYNISQGWGHFFRQVLSFTHKCLLFVLQQRPDASNKLMGPLSCTRGSQWHQTTMPLSRQSLCYDCYFRKIITFAVVLDWNNAVEKKERRKRKPVRCN